MWRTVYAVHSAKCSAAQSTQNRLNNVFELESEWARARARARAKEMMCKKKKRYFCLLTINSRCFHPHVRLSSVQMPLVYAMTNGGRAQWSTDAKLLRCRRIADAIGHLVCPRCPLTLSDARALSHSITVLVTWRRRWCRLSCQWITLFFLQTNML